MEVASVLLADPAKATLCQVGYLDSLPPSHILVLVMEDDYCGTRYWLGDRGVHHTRCSQLGTARAPKTVTLEMRHSFEC